MRLQIFAGFLLLTNQNYPGSESRARMPALVQAAFGLLSDSIHRTAQLRSSGPGWPREVRSRLRGTSRARAESTERRFRSTLALGHGTLQQQGPLYNPKQTRKPWRSSCASVQFQNSPLNMRCCYPAQSADTGQLWAKPQFEVRHPHRWLPPALHPKYFTPQCTGELQNRGSSESVFILIVCLSFMAARLVSLDISRG